MNATISRLELRFGVCSAFSELARILAHSAGQKGVTEDDIMENAITLVYSITGKSYNQKTL
jgi:hypothetical protein